MKYCILMGCPRKNGHTQKLMTPFIEELENKGILEDTVIVLLADHYPYGLSLEEINKKPKVYDWIRIESSCGKIYYLDQNNYLNDTFI